MAIPYLLGNFIGRLLMSFILVWVVWLLASRFNWRLALARSGRWYSLVVVFVLAVLGMGSAFVSAGGAA
jgi:predicted PurR-regulated permease PerM